MRKFAGPAPVLTPVTRLRRLLLPSLLLASVAGSGCFTFRRPEVVFRGVEFGSLDASGAALEASFDVTNPNRYRIGVRRLTYRVSVNGRDAGGGASDQETVLEGKATTLVKLPLTLDWSKVSGASLPIVSNQVQNFARRASNEVR